MLWRSFQRALGVIALLAVAALATVSVAHWQVERWLEQQRKLLQGSGYFSFAGHSVNPFVGSVVLRQLRISTAANADYLSIPSLEVHGFSPSQLLLGLWPSGALSFRAPRVELFRRGDLYQAWAARVAPACSSSGSWADAQVDSRGYIVAKLHGQLGESDIFGEYQLDATLESQPTGALQVVAELATQRATMAELELAMWPQLAAMQLRMTPDADALQSHYQHCADEAGISLEAWRSAVTSWQLGPLEVTPREPQDVVEWLAAPQALQLDVERSEYSLVEWAGLAGAYRLDRGSRLQWRTGSHSQLLEAVATLAPRQSVAPDMPHSEPQQPLPVYARQPWRQLPSAVGRSVKVYLVERAQPQMGELVEVDGRSLLLLQRHTQGEVTLPLARDTIVRVEVLN